MFGRYAILLSVTAGILELVPIIGPIISAVPAVLLAATAGIEPVIAALILYTLVQQIENNLLVPKIQGDAVALHPAAVMFAIIIGGALAGLLGAILALPGDRRGARRRPLPVPPASPGDSTALADSIATLGLETHPGVPNAEGTTHGERASVSGTDPYKVLQVDPEAEDEVIAAAYRRLARKYHPDTATGAESSGRMEAINAAWEVLGDPGRRAAHDRQRALQAAVSGAAREEPRTPPPEVPRRRRVPPLPPPDPRPRPVAGLNPVRRSPRPSRATGRAAARRSAAATTSRCARQTTWAPPASRRATHRAAS